MVIEGLNMFWKKTQNHNIPHMMMTLKGRCKGRNNLRWHCVLFAYQTKCGIPTRMWISRILYGKCELENQERGLLLDRDNGRKAIIGYYDPMFRNFLEQGKICTRSCSTKEFSLETSA